MKWTVTRFGCVVWLDCHLWLAVRHVIKGTPSLKFPFAVCSSTVVVASNMAYSDVTVVVWLGRLVSKRLGYLEDALSVFRQLHEATPQNAEVVCQVGMPVPNFLPSLACLCITPLQKGSRRKLIFASRFLVGRPVYCNEVICKAVDIGDPAMSAGNMHSCRN